MEKAIDYLKSKKPFVLLYWVTRILMALGFILSGIRKLPGIKFTILDASNPVGAYFQAMYDTGFYWNFIGYFQILVGVLLLFNRFKILAPVLMMPVTINIWLLSIALNMRGTPIITSLMVLGNIFLMVWHYRYYLPLLKKPKQLKREESNSY
ncbi:DoxX family membrane protein [Polaribacter batillariae]|uniref:DoxX family membrane protein n=1 Tax=Polaribacter batillariae TaxID=2808900 RepID=A0ABX7SZ19_9FLAO|nr:DoxX family membrane protein [Polaribacter batillariae]QTD38083.1 DoxX family membrane protein [Polaribacter batillariae]